MTELGLPTSSYLEAASEVDGSGKTPIKRIRFRRGKETVYVMDSGHAGYVEDWEKDPARKEDLLSVRNYGGGVVDVPNPLEFGVADGTLAVKLQSLTAPVIREMMTRDPRPNAEIVYIDALSMAIHELPVGQKPSPVERVHMAVEAGGIDEALVGINFGSDEAVELVLKKNRDGVISAADFVGVKPSGKKGYTLTDVKKLIAAKEKTVEE